MSWGVEGEQGCMGGKSSHFTEQDQSQRSWWGKEGVSL